MDHIVTCWSMLYLDIVVVFFVKQKTAYELRISDWSSDVCVSDLFMSTLASEACMQAQGTEGGPDSGASGLKEELTSDAKQLGNSAQRRVEEEAEKRQQHRR